MPIKIRAPFEQGVVQKLKAGDEVLICGTIYTARDMAHKMLVNVIKANETLPLALDGQMIYYVGPCPKKANEIIGSAGPTTSSRMDNYAPELLDAGLSAMIGKGLRSKEVVEAIVKNKAVYFGAQGGAGALIAKCVKEYSVLKWEELGTEAMCKLIVEDFPAVVLIDSFGNNFYKIGPENYLKSLRKDDF